MRAVIAVLVVALVLAPTVAAKPPPPRIVWAGVFSDLGVGVIAWAPVKEADEYVVYRGESLDSMVAIGRTTLTAFLDEHAPPVHVYYGVSAVDDGGESPMSSVGVPSGQGCRVWQSGTSIRTPDLQDCLPPVPAG